MTNFGIKFESRKRQFYSAHVATFWKFSAQTAQICGCVLSTAAATAVLSGHNMAAAYTSLAVAFIGLFSIVCNAEGKWRAANTAANGWMRLESRVPDDAAKRDESASEENAAEFERLMEQDEGFCSCLDAISDNEACVAFDIEPRNRLSLFESWIGRYLPLVIYKQKYVKAARLPIPPRPEGQ